jgi:OmcA/MtrC family decaheme c-type cytochrome
MATILPGTTQEISDVRDQAFNDTIYFPVDGSPVAPRRAVVSLDKCNACHGELSLHGGNRNNIDYCVMCHRPNAATAAQGTDPGESIDMRMMVHRIHSGAELTRKYGIGGADFSHVEYPGFRQNCSGCHVGNSQQLPLRQDLLKVSDPMGWLNPVGPEAGACLACHDSIQAASHALANTSALGESCATCHGPSADFSVDQVHAR